MLNLICKELGVEVGEKWKNDVGDTYKLTKDGLFYEYLPGEWEEVGSPDYMRLLKGELKPMWKPKDGEEYQIPQLSSHLKFSSRIWYDDEVDYILMRRGIVFKTKDEAIAAANKMLNVLK